MYSDLNSIFVKKNFNTLIKCCDKDKLLHNFKFDEKCLLENFSNYLTIIKTQDFPESFIKELELKITNEHKNNTHVCKSKIKELHEHIIIHKKISIELMNSIIAENHYALQQYLFKSKFYEESRLTELIKTNPEVLPIINYFGYMWKSKLFSVDFYKEFSHIVNWKEFSQFQFDKDTNKFKVFKIYEEFEDKVNWTYIFENTITNYYNYKIANWLALYKEKDIDWEHLSKFTLTDKWIQLFGNKLNLEMVLQNNPSSRAQVIKTFKILKNIN